MNDFPQTLTETGECLVCYEQKDEESDKCEHLTNLRVQIELQSCVLYRLRHDFIPLCALQYENLKLLKFDIKIFQVSEKTVPFKMKNIFVNVI